MTKSDILNQPMTLKTMLVVDSVLLILVGILLKVLL